MAREKHAHEPTVKEMQRLIYQVNKRLYRLEKAGAHDMNTTYENALAIIQRNEQKQNKKRLTIPKNNIESLKRQYMKALEITGGGSYEELSVKHIKEQILQAKKERAGINREGTFKNVYNITNVDYATYNLFRSREFKQLADSLGSDVVLKVIAPAINTGMSTSQLRGMLREYQKQTALDNDDMYYIDKFNQIVDKYAQKYGDNDIF